MEKHIHFKETQRGSLRLTAVIVKLLGVISGLITFWILVILLFLGACVGG